MKRMFAALLLMMLTTTQVSAQISVDGVLDDAYTLAATQTNNTGFGDNFSELCAIYTATEGSRIFVMITGNLEANFNKLEVFIDSMDGGENPLSSTPQYDFLFDGGPFWISQFLGGTPGLTFDPGFDCDFHLLIRHGDPGDGNIFDADFINRMGGTSAMVPVNAARAAFDTMTLTASTSIEAGSPGLNSSGVDANLESIFVAIDNSNVDGISGDTSVPADAAAAEAVTTGIEFSIDVSDLGLDPSVAGTVKVNAMVNGVNHDFMSNQILPGVDAPMGNLGGDNMGNFTGNVGGVDFTAFAGDQFVCIEYEPSAGVLLGDVNCDGVVNLLDVAPFVDILTSGGFSPKADINEDGNVNLLDVAPFVDLLAG